MYKDEIVRTVYVSEELASLLADLAIVPMIDYEDSINKLEQVLSLNNEIKYLINVYKEAYKASNIIKVQHTTSISEVE